MSDDTFNRKSFRVGQGGYDVLQQPQAPEEERSKEGRDDGRGEATASGNPKIHEGDELYDVLYRERAERMRTENIVSRSEQHNGNANAFVAGVLLGEALSHDRDQQQDQQPTQQPEQFPDAARAEVTQPSAEHQGRASVHAMRVEQAEATPQPTPSGLSDYVSEDTAQKVYDQQQQPEQGQEQEAPTRPGSDLSDYVSEGTFAKVQAEQSRQRSNANTLSLGMTDEAGRDLPPLKVVPPAPDDRREDDWMFLAIKHDAQMRREMMEQATDDQRREWRERAKAKGAVPSLRVIEQGD